MRWVMIMLAALLSGCQSRSLPEVAMARDVELARFMGAWFVLAHIPLPPEKQAWNAVEHYRLADDGRIETTFVFRQGAADGKRKTFHPVATVSKDDTARWAMQFIWPFKADFRISWLDDAYQLTVIGREKRDYVWVMARTPQISAQQWQEMNTFLDAQGYDLDKLRRVPQQWQGPSGYTFD